MPITAAEFNEADPDIRDFWHNFSDQYLAIAHVYYDPDVGPFGPYYPAYYWGGWPKKPTNMFAKNKLYCLIHGIPYDPNRPILLSPNNLSEPPISPIQDEYTGSGYADNWYWIPEYYPDINKPGPPDPTDDIRPKIRVQKSYWTGCARPRRNL